MIDKIKKYLNKKRSLRAQLITAIILFSALTFIVFMLLFSIVREIIVDRYTDAAVQSVNAVSANIDYTLAEIENLSKTILFNSELVEKIKKGSGADFLESLNGYYNSTSNIEGIYILNDSGYYQIGSKITDGVNSFPTDELLKTKGEIIWLPTRNLEIRIMSGSLPRRFFAMARKIVNVNSLETIGEMSFEINESLLAEGYEGLKEEGANIYILDNNGNLLSATGSAASISMISEQVREGKISGVIEYKSAVGNMVAIYAPCNQERWHIIKTIPKSTLYARVNELQSFVIIGSFAVIVFLLFIINIYTKRLTEPIERNKYELELEVLHAQINPHFLYNTLNTIRLMAKIKGEDSISDALVALSKLLRISISLGKDMIPLSEELTYVDNYLLIHKLRFNMGFKINLSIREEDKNKQIPKLILQPLVENALIYAEDDVEPVIDIYTEDSDRMKNSINIVVKDNGPGISPEKIEAIFTPKSGIERFSKVGLNNVNQRIKLYFGEEYGLFIESRAGEGTRVIIHVP